MPCRINIMSCENDVCISALKLASQLSSLYLRLEITRVKFWPSIESCVKKLLEAVHNGL